MCALLTEAFAASFTHTYDPLDRLTSITYPNGSKIEYTYDANGNRLTHKTNGPQFATFLYPETKEVPGVAGNYTVDLTANGPWTATTDESWASLNPSTGSASAPLTVTYPQNPSLRARDIKIQVGTAVHTMRQLPAGTTASGSVSQLLELNVAGEGAIESVTGLPPGMSYNATTGLLTGRPTGSGIYTVFIRANVPGRGIVTDSAAITVESLPQFSVGSFTALISPPAPAGANLDGLGGYLTLSATSNGTFTGSLQLGAKAFPFAGQMNGLTASARGSAPLRSQATIITNAANRTQDLVLNLEFRPEDHATAPGLTGNMTFQGTTLPIGPGWQHVWNATTHPAWAGTDRTLNVAIKNTETNGPAGQGFATVRLTKAGLVTWTGTLADGRTFTANFTATPAGDLPVYVPVPYPGAGCLVALVPTQLGTDGLLRVRENGVADGNWIKRTSSDATDRSYRTGFDVDVDIYGAEYRAPATGQLLFGAATVPAVLDWTMSGAGIAAVYPTKATAGVVRFDAQLLTGNSISIVSGGLANAPKPTFLPGTGALSGTASLSDVVGTTTVPRTLSFNGLYIPDLDLPANSSISGFFLLPELPAGTQSPTSTPIQSGNLEISRPLP